MGLHVNNSGLRSLRKVSIGCWNMRTLVEADGSIATGVSRRGGRGVTVDKKSVFMVQQLKKFRMSIVGISETKWFGCHIYDVDGFLILHSGRPIPEVGEPVMRNEGVGIVLDPFMAECWRNGGAIWNAVSSRIVTARLRMSNKDGKPWFLSVVSVYAPTHRSSQVVKDKFYDDLQCVVDSIGVDDVLVILGDFNARVGCGSLGDEWSDVRGRHGIGKINGSGEALLSWCALNNLVVLNTVFQKKDIHKVTWQHPGSKQWHCIDYVIMRQSQRFMCCDVSVLRSADCWTDHKLVRAKLRFSVSVKRSGVSGRTRFAVGRLKDSEIRAEYQERVCTAVESGWDNTKSVSEMWGVLSEGMVEAASEVLGLEVRRQPDWYRDNENVLTASINKRNALFHKWLSSRKNSDRKRYVVQRRLVAKTVKRVKNEWLQNRAREIEAGMLSRGSSAGAWKSLKDIKKGRAGLRPVLTKVVKKANGELCIGRDESLQRWREHFHGVLNIRSSFLASVVDEVEDYPIDESLDVPPSEEEILDVIKLIKGGKAAGKNGVLPEMIKCCGLDLLDYLVVLFQSVWSEGSVPQEWKDALIVPIPKKGDLSLCDNWRGISLLDLGGKVFAKIIQQRLQSVAERVLPESQCGFRSGRGCVDMIFCARQLVEKAVEHNTQVFMLFIDLRKAYDSIPREALWRVLVKYGIPPSMVAVIRSLHDGMYAEVSVDGDVANEFEVCNGLRQGCVVAPTLFNLYFGLVIQQWRAKCSTFGVKILYKCGGKLVGERSRRLDRCLLTELLFADDAVAVGSDRRSMERAAVELERIITGWGLTLSIGKTKLLVAGVPRSNVDTSPIVLKGGEIECVTEFKYLGSVLEASGGVMAEVSERIAKASKAFGALKEPIFKNSDLSCKTKCCVYKSVVLGVLLYGSETWTTKRASTKKLEVFHNRCLRSILGISSVQQRMEHISSVDIAKRFGMSESLEDSIAARRLRWLGHVARMDNQRLPKILLFGRLPQSRPTHGTKMRWRDRISKDLVKFGLNQNAWYSVSQERSKWRGDCREGLADVTNKRLQDDVLKRAAASTRPIGPFECPVCKRCFSRQQDIARHRCVTTRPRH